MLQVIQSLKDGATELVEVPAPKCKRGHLLIQTSTTLISAGTERMLVKFGKSSYLQKARSQPDKVKQVVAKIKTDGFKTTIEAVKSKLAAPIPLGYCNVGVVLEVGEDVQGFTPGDRVVSNAGHVGVACVPKNLCAKVPTDVSDESAVYTVIASIALQGVRLVQPTLGETIVVTGLGLVGLLAVQILRAHGCNVIGIDFDLRRCELAKNFGAEVVCLSSGEDPVAFAEKFTHSAGVDAVLITASTSSSEPVHQAATMCRKRGRIVLVGVTGLELSRDDFYKKELSFQVSCSYGPGRHDPQYENQGLDYPLPFVRWTEQRNFEAILGLMRQGQLKVGAMTTHRYAIQNAVEAYKTLNEDKAALGILLSYPLELAKPELRQIDLGANYQSTEVNVAFIGAGNFASRMLMPAFKEAEAGLYTVVSGQGLNGTLQAKKHGFAHSATDYTAVLQDESVNTVVIATPHNLHAEQVVQALEAGKHVFVEKPLAISMGQLEAIESCYKNLAKIPQLMLGFNRRFSPQIQIIKQYLSPGQVPVSMVMTVNAGSIPADHWTQQLEVGGGRLIGEACHFIDLLRYLADSPIVSAEAILLGKTPCKDTFTISLQFENGSIGTVHYFANGHALMPKERLQVFSSGKVFDLNNFRTLTALGVKGFKKNKLKKMDKGHAAEVRAFCEAIISGKSPIPFAEIMEVSRCAIELANQAV